MSSPLPPALRRSAGLLTMLQSISLLKPSLNPGCASNCNFALLWPGRISRVCFRLVPRAQASGSGRSVWEDAAEEFFRAKGQKQPASASPGERSGRESKPYGRRGSDARSGKDDADAGARKNAASSQSSGSQYSKAVSFAGREWGDGSGGEDRRGAGTASTWSKAAPERRASKLAYSAPRRERPDGYRNDRGGGYGGGERRMTPRRERNEDEEGDEEEEEDDAARLKREPVNWRLEGEALYGVAPIRAALLAERRTFHTLYVQESLVENVASGKRKDKQALNWILNRAHNLEMKVETTSKQNLNLLVDNRPHQGLVLDASPLELVPCEYLEKPAQDGRPSVWVALDEVVDPQNFGAILRSCHYLGATGVVVCAKNSAPLSGVVSKASAGALEVMEIQSCRNMMKFLDTSVLNGWRAVGASSEVRALPIQDLEPGFPTILVLGNEGRGLRTNVKRSCTELVSIKGFGGAAESSALVQHDIDLNVLRPFGSETQAALEAVDSLNVSVAAGILLHDLLSRSIQNRTPATNSVE